MAGIGFLGCGKIGRKLYREIKDSQLGKVIFIQDKNKNDFPFPEQVIISEYRQDLYEKTDLMIECATAQALEGQIDYILMHCDLLMFSVTAFSDIEFENKVKYLTDKYHHHVYIPHGAILGLEGIKDGSKLWEEITIETIKSPGSFGRDEKERIILYEGSAREACRLFPRNVNVHAAVALAGIGFDRTHSVIISDPQVHTNTHVITLRGQGIDIKLQISSFSEGGVTGLYTPFSACGSLHRILDKEALLVV